MVLLCKGKKEFNLYKVDFNYYHYCMLLPIFDDIKIIVIIMIVNYHNVCNFS